MVLFVAEFIVPRSLRKVVAQRRFEIRVDSAFRQVIEACAEPRTDDGGTWNIRGEFFLRRRED